MNPSDSDAWDRHARWWQDGFTDGADPEYEDQILPLVTDLLRGRARVLDVGCGEGQVARRLASEGDAMVVGIDPTNAQLREATRRGGGVDYVECPAELLALSAGSFDGAVVCLVFEHIEALDAAVSEIARVLCRGGRFVLVLNHPLIQTPGSGWIDDHVMDPPEQYWRIGPYLVEQTTSEEVEAGVVLPFVHRPLSRYVNSLVDHGLRIERMIEQAPPSSFIARAAEYRDADTIPRLLVLVADKR